MEKIEDIVSDDFCAGGELILANEKNNLTELEKTAFQKLVKIYKIAHAFNEKHKCYGAHEDWRREAE